MSEQEGGNARLVHWGIVSILLVSMGLRVFRLAEQSIWYDEAFDILFAQKPWSVIWAQAVNDTMPSLHYLLLHTWMSLGPDEFFAKLFSVYLGLLAVAVTFVVGRRLFGPKVGLGGALLMAVSPFQIYYAREVRMYSQLLFFGVLSVFFFVRCLGEIGNGHGDAFSTRWRDWLGLVLSTSLLVNSHTLGFIVPLTVGAVALVLRWRQRGFVWRLLLSGVAVCILASPWLLFVLPAQLGRVARTFWVSRPSLMSPLVTLYLFLVGHSVPPTWSAVALFSTLGLSVVAICEVRKRFSQSVALLLVWLFAPIVIVWCVSLISPIYLDRLFITGAPAFYLLLVLGFESMPRVLRWLLGGVLGVMMLLSLCHFYFDPGYQKPPMRDAVLYVADHYEPGDVVLHTGDSSFLTFVVYRSDWQQALVQGDPDHVDGAARSESLKLLGLEAVTPDEIVKGHRRTWLVVAPDHSVEFQEQVADRLLATYSGQEMTNLRGIRIYLLRS